MLLPSKKSPRTIDINNISVVIHGIPKIGKSTWCSQIPNCLALLFEPGWNAIEAYKMDIKQWEDLKEVYKSLQTLDRQKKLKEKYGAIIIDTIDIAHERCADFICRKYNVAHQADLQYGKGWAFVTTEFRMMLTNLAQLSIPLFLVSHTKEIEVEKRAEKYRMQSLSISDSPKRIVLGLVEIILYFDVAYSQSERKQVRVVRTKPNKYFEAGDRTGILPATMRMKYSDFAEAFEKYNEKLNKK